MFKPLITIRHPLKFDEILKKEYKTTDQIEWKPDDNEESIAASKSTAVSQNGEANLVSFRLKRYQEEDGKYTKNNTSIEITEVRTCTIHIHPTHFF